MNGQAHLTEDQLDEILLEGRTALPAAALAHLDGCDLCSTQIGAMQAPLASFREMSLAWAERRSATLPLRPAALEHGRRPRPHLAWASVAAAVVAVAVAVPMAHERANADATSTVPEASTMAVVGHTGMTSVTPVAASPEQIKTDNQMLQEIDRALDAPASSPAEYGLLPASAHTRGQGRQPSLRD